jgi:hypothetical protein
VAEQDVPRSQPFSGRRINPPFVEQLSAIPAEASASRSGAAATDRVESGRWPVANKRTVRKTKVKWRRLHFKGVVKDNCPLMCKSLETRLIEKIQWAYEDGSPIAGSSPEMWAEMAAIARRRWFSFVRRSGNGGRDRAARIDDLSRGLCEKFASGGLPIAGPLIADYRWLAEQLAGEFENESE